jgi:hypothetical protein
MGMYLAHQLVGGVDVQTQQLDSNPRGGEFSSYLYLRIRLFLGLHVIYLEDQVSALSKIKNHGTHA